MPKHLTHRLLAITGTRPQVGDRLPDDTIVTAIEDLPGDKILIHRAGEHSVCWALKKKV